MVMKKTMTGFVLGAVIAVLFGVGSFWPAGACAADIRSRTFTDEEISAMKVQKAIIQTRFGNIVLKFFPDVAPNHVHNFIELARKGFYDGTTFHRVIPGFMIQGGDPNSRDADRMRHGTGGPGHQLKAEFNSRPHKRGTLSMARSRHPDSAGSQFFICVAEAPSLDGQYTVFGEVAEGMAVVDAIVSEERDSRDNPLKPIEMTVKIEKAED
ncbi:PpiA2: peptidyl-prolyl cis-trans isomerase A [Desulfococcus multivorans]|nr:PpiA2: peptidyl-prolyl cis-trans isomerase A [Desulfococcus multivorans]